MPTLYALKPHFRVLPRPAAAQLAHSCVTADQVTLFSCLGSPLVGLVLSRGAGRPLLLLLPVWLLPRITLDAIDRMLAREFRQQSPPGAYQNELGDIVSDAALYLPFGQVPPLSAVWVDGAVVLTILLESTGVLGLMVGASRRCDGPLGKSDRALVFGALGFSAALEEAAAGLAALVDAARAGASSFHDRQSSPRGVAEARQRDGG